MVAQGLLDVVSFGGWIIKLGCVVDMCKQTWAVARGSAATTSPVRYTNTQQEEQQTRAPASFAVERRKTDHYAHKM